MQPYFKPKNILEVVPGIQYGFGCFLLIEATSYLFSSKEKHAPAIAHHEDKHTDNHDKHDKHEKHDKHTDSHKSDKDHSKH